MEKVGDHCLRRALARLPSASSAARRLLFLPAMVLGAALVISKRKLEVGKDLKAKGLVKSWGHLRFYLLDWSKRSWPQIVARIPKNVEGVEISLTDSPSGRLGFKAESYSVDWLG
jgi:hypothetical protein